MASSDAISCDIYPNIIHKSESEYSSAGITSQQGFASGISYSPPKLRVHREDKEPGREVLVAIKVPGTYVIRVWTEAEWDNLDAGDRLKQAYRHGSCWFSFARRASGVILMLCFEACKGLIA